MEKPAKGIGQRNWRGRPYSAASERPYSAASAMLKTQSTLGNDRGGSCYSQSSTICTLFALEKSGAAPLFDDAFLLGHGWQRRHSPSWAWPTASACRQERSDHTIDNNQPINPVDFLQKVLYKGC